jgi:hypothetical protein
METFLNRLADLKDNGMVTDSNMAEMTMRSFVEIEIWKGRRMLPLNLL